MNKDVRRLVLDVTFLDADGKPLRGAPPENFDYQPHLVARQDSKELKQSGFFVPEGAATAEFRAREIGFADGTTWKAGAK